MSKKILIVDDDQSIRTYFRTFLKKQGYECLEAENGEEGLQMALEKRPDLILLDIQMPVMSGITVCKILREDPRNDAIYVIILTASSTKEVESLNTGADDYMTKPVKDRSVFLARVQKALRQAELRRNLLIDEFGLTKFPFFLNSLEVEMYRSKRYRHDLSLILFSLDGFEGVREKGEEIEKKILSVIVELLVLRKSDLVSLEDAGKFVLLLPAISSSGALVVAERLRKQIGSYEFSEGLRLTASFSVVSMDHTKNLLSAAGNYLLDVERDGIVMNGQLCKGKEG